MNALEVMAGVGALSSAIISIFDMTICCNLTPQFAFGGKSHKRLTWLCQIKISNYGIEIRNVSHLSPPFLVPSFI